MSKIKRTVPRFPQGGTTYTDPSCIILPYNTPSPVKFFRERGRGFFEIFGQNLYKNIACDATTTLFRKRHDLLNYYVIRFYRLFPERYAISPFFATGNLSASEVSDDEDVFLYNKANSETVTLTAA